MAILPNSGEKIPTEEYKPAPSANTTTPSTAGPKPITIEEYRRRQERKIEEQLTRIPKVNKPRHKRGGKIVRLRRKLAALRNIVNADPPPSWQRASEIWLQIDMLEREMNQHRKKQT